MATPRKLKDALLKVRVGDRELGLALGDIPAGVTGREFWLPVVPGRGLNLSLYSNGLFLAEAWEEVEVKGPLWWKLGIKTPPINPLDYGYALLPKTKVLVERGEDVGLELAIVGLSPKFRTVDFLLEIKAREGRGEVILKAARDMVVSFAKRTTWAKDIPTENILPGRYVLDLNLKGAEGASLGGLRRELIVVEPRRLKERFTGIYTDLKYDYPVIVGERKGKVSWDRLLPHFGPFSDVVVSFEGKPYKWVFWRGTSYVPAWALGDVWFCYEWVETYGHRLPQDGDCVEPIMDRECRYSRVKIIESSPARVLVHWRYAESGFKYSICDDEWVDEYYYFYPDMVGVRKIMGWILKGSWHETNEFITVLPAGMHPREALELRSMTIMDLEGNHLNLDYPDPWKNWEARWSDFSEGKSSFIFRQ
ncbi:TPA: hypothetical protein EYP44_04995, partial [Candidatus Bathyarchaeota archaeon]|nr:hypothetical protein [Candidatus Bathyarchaeota archaeon]